MDYYQGSSSRGRSFSRGSSYRGSSRGDSRRGFRGTRGGSSRGSSRGRGSSSSFYSSKYDSNSSDKYIGSIDSSKYASSSGRYEESYHRRADTSHREHRGTDISDIGSRKRVRSFSPSQGSTSYSRRAIESEDYRPASSRRTESSRYESERVFKKPRITEHSSVRNDYRVKEPLRVRSSRGRIGMRGSTRRGFDRFGPRGRGSSFARSTGTASTSEILAIRRAKLLKDRKLPKGDEGTDGKENDMKSAEGGGTVGDGSSKDVERALTDLENDDVADLSSAFGRSFVKLDCPHCPVKCVTFKEYTRHLHEAIHVKAMKAKVDDLKSTLATMRIAQREQQKVADAEDLTDMGGKPLFCQVCKLNYSQDKSIHQASELHKKLKEFLLPNCSICHTTFQSPIAYENHLCSLLHLRTKHTVEQREKLKESAELLSEKFMVVDSVGSGDEADENDKDASKEKEEEEDLTLGAEFVHEVKAMYCEVCRTYLPRKKDTERALKHHCRTKEHLRCYLHYGNDSLLEKMNESVEEDDKKIAVKTEKKEIKEGEDEAADGDKLWEDVGELLSETQAREKSDDEDEESGRFDRFKMQKQENGTIAEEEESAKPEVASVEKAAEPEKMEA